MVGITVGHRAFLPWNAPDGVPEFIIAGRALGMPQAMRSRRRAGVLVRVLPDGCPQLLAPTASGARVVRLSESPMHVDIASAGQILDAVLETDLHVLVLERAGNSFGLCRVRPDGTIDWRIPRIDATEKSRLLADPNGQVLLTGEHALLRVDDRSGTDVAGARPGSQAVMYPDGRLGFSSYDNVRDVRDWVELDLWTGAESSVDGTDENWDILHRPIGVDAARRVYGDSPYFMGRITACGEVDWALSMNGVAISRGLDMAILTVDDDGSGQLCDSGGRLIATLLPEESDGRLVGRTDDGYILHSASRHGEGELWHLDAEGRVTIREPAGPEPRLRFDYIGRPAASSVTREGEVLVPVLSFDGVHVVALSPGPGKGEGQ